jgi:hypothetical protein
VLQYHFNWKVLSAVAGITWWNFYFRLYQRTIRAPQVVDFLAHLLRQLPGRLLVIWDRSKTHRSRLVGEFVAGQRGRLALDYLPAYAPNSIRWSTYGFTPRACCRNPEKCGPRRICVDRRQRSKACAATRRGAAMFIEVSANVA